MTGNDVRLFIEVTTRQAEDAFRRRIEESSPGIEEQQTTSRTNWQPQVFTKPRKLWWAEQQRYDAAAGRMHSSKEGDQ